MIITSVKLEDTKDLPLLYSFGWNSAQQSGTTFYRKDVPFDGMYEVWIRNIGFAPQPGTPYGAGTSSRICLMSDILQVPIMSGNTRVIGGSTNQAYVLPQFNAIDINHLIRMANCQAGRGFHLGAIQIFGYINVRIAFPNNNTNPGNFAFCCIDLELRYLGREYNVENSWKLPKYLPATPPISRQLILTTKPSDPRYLNIEVGLVGKFRMKICAYYYVQAISGSAINALFAITSPCFRVPYSQLNWRSPMTLNVSTSQTILLGYNGNRRGGHMSATEVECDIYNRMDIFYFDLVSNSFLSATDIDYTNQLILFCEFYPI